MRRGAARMAFAALLPGLVGCGYQMEAQHLPQNASTLAIGAVRNRTFTGELDLRLKDQLRRRLMRNPSFALTAAEGSELILEIDLTHAAFIRALDVSNTNLSSLSMRLRGRVRLRGTGAEAKLIRSQAISVGVTLSFDQPVIETPAVRDEITGDAIAAFVERVEAMLYGNF